MTDVAPIPVRSRVMSRARAVDLNEPVAAVQSKVTKQMRDLATARYRANKAANAATSTVRSCDKDLKVLLTDANLSAFDLKVDGKPVEVTYDFQSENIVDLARLKKLVSEEDFYKIISATQDAVKKAVGENILNACLVERTKTEKTLSIKDKK